MKRSIELVQINPGLNIVGQPHTIVVYKGVPVTLNFKGIGGKAGKYIFALLAGFGALAPGLANTSVAGSDYYTVSGTPTAFGDYPFTLTVTNNGRSIKKSFIIRVPELNLQIIQTAPIYKGVPLAGQLRLLGTGGSGLLTYSIQSPYSLPSGWTLDPATGIFAGTPASQMTYALHGQVTDSATNTATAFANIDFLSPLVVSNTPKEFELGHAMTPVQLTVKNATGSVAWTGLSGAPGLSLSSGGVLSGTLTTLTPGLNTISARVTDSGTVTHLDFSFNVFVYAAPVATYDNAVVNPSGIGGTFLPPVIIGKPYSATVSVAGGKGPFRFADNGGWWASLGFSVNPNTGEVTGTVNALPGSVSQTGYDGFTLVEVSVTDRFGAISTAQAGVIFLFEQNLLETQHAGTSVGNAGAYKLNFYGSRVDNTGTQATIDGRMYVGVTSNVGNAYTAAPSTPFTVYVDGQQYSAKFNAANTGPATIEISGLGPKDLYKNGAALSSGDIAANGLISFTYLAADDRCHLTGDGGTNSSGGSSGGGSVSVYFA